MFSSQSRSRINNICIADSSLQCIEGDSIYGLYFAYMRSLADQLAAAGKPLAEDVVISYMIAGLDMEYQPLVSALDARTEQVSLDELFTQMSNFDQCVALFHGSGSNTGF